MELLPTTALEPTSEQFTFTYPASDLFLDLSQTLIRYDWFLMAGLCLRFTAKIVNEDGTPLAVDEAAVATGAVGGTGRPALVSPKVAPCNFLAMNFVRQLKLYSNSTLLYDSGDNAAYLSTISTMLNYDEDSKESWLKPSVYEHNEAGKINDPTNKGHMGRVEYFKTKIKGTATEREIVGFIGGDFFNLNRFFPNHMQV